MAEYNIQQKVLNSGGVYDNLYPKSKAGLVEITDTAGNFVSTDVEGALAETAELVSTHMPIAGGTFTGVAKAQVNASYTTAQLRNTILSTADPSGGSNGYIWIKYS